MCSDVPAQLFPKTRVNMSSVQEDPCLNGNVGVRRAASENDAKLGTNYIESVNRARGSQGKLSYCLRQSRSSDFSHVACDSHSYCYMGPLNDFDIHFVIGLDIQDTGHEYLTQVIGFESLEVGFELRSCHGEFSNLPVMRPLYSPVILLET